MEDLSYKTAITRKKLSVPMKYLNDKGLIQGRVLDYGCGKGFDANELGMDKYDPKFFPEYPNPPYEVVTCIYVLNVESNPLERGNIERRIVSLLVPGGDAYIAVRNDKKNLNGKTSKGTWQGYVEPSDDWDLIKTTARFRMYHFRKPIELKPCPHCYRENDDGTWFTPCPSDDCPSRDEVDHG